MAALKTILGNIPSMKTVVRTYRGVDITMYPDTDLPLVDMREPDEAGAEELTGFRAINKLGLGWRVYFVSWGDDATSTYEALVKDIRNKIGSDFKATGTATKALVVSVSTIQGEMPLYWVDIGLDIRYYLDQQDV